MKENLDLITARPTDARDLTRSPHSGLHKLNLFDYLNIFFLSLLALLIVYPFYNTILVSVVPQQVYSRTPFMLWPSEITWDYYQFVFDSPLLLMTMANSAKLAVIGTAYNMLLTVLMAYAFTKPIPGRRFFRFLMVFTMYFGGGLIPFYLLIKALGLVNSFWVMVLPTGVSVIYMLIISSHIASLPAELEESARIDGAGDLRILVSVILPLSLPILATFTLYYAVERWNEWFNGMLFLNDQKLWPLQLTLRNIITNANFIATQAMTGEIRPPTYGDGVKMACIVVTIFPLMAVYPFLQRYFLTGLTIGAVKG